MERYLKTKAIVLKRTNYNEADRLLTLYTEEKGKVTAIAKGVRKISSKKRGHLELFNLVDIQAIDHKGWYILTQVESIKTYPELKNDLQLTTYGYYISEIFEKLVPELEPNETLFKILTKTLDYINKSSGLTFINAFNLKLLRMLGFYSKTELKNLDATIRNYLDEIEIQTYEYLSLKKYNLETEKLAHNFLKNFTENVIESGIKTELV